MAFVYALPVVLSFGVLAAHFLRAGHMALVAVAIFLPLLLFVPKAAVARALQVALLLASIEWVRTMYVIGQERMAAGAPYLRSVLILAAVAAFTLASAFVFHLPVMRRRYGLARSS